MHVESTTVPFTPLSEEDIVLKRVDLCKFLTSLRRINLQTTFTEKLQIKMINFWILKRKYLRRFSQTKVNKLKKEKPL